MGFVGLICSVSLLSPKQARAAAGVAGLLSIIPGLGQIYDGETLEGLGWFSTVIGFEIFSPAVNISAPVAGQNTRLLAQAGYDLWLYNMYDAYRDAKPRNGLYTNYSAFSNYVAAFNPVNVADAVTGTYLGFNVILDRKELGHFGQLNRYPFFAFVGMGEEGLFRGFLFPAFSADVFHSKIAGAFASTVLFDLFHLTNGAADFRNNFIQRFIMGLVFCWATDRNKYDLRDGIFAHSMIDIGAEAGAGTPHAFLGMTGVKLGWKFFL